MGDSPEGILYATEREGLVIVTNPPTPTATESLLDLILKSLDDDKAIAVVSIDLAGKSSIADYMIVASGSSSRHVGSMTDHLREKLKVSGVKGVSVEGMENCDWVLIDSGDVIVHLFRPEVREFYNIEKLWSEALPESIDRAAAQH